MVLKAGSFVFLQGIPEQIVDFDKTPTKLK